VTAHVGEGINDAVRSTGDDHGLIRNGAGEIVAGLADLVSVANELPGGAEDFLFLEKQRRGIEIPRGRKRGGTREVRVEFVAVSGHEIKGLTLPSFGPTRGVEPADEGISRDVNEVRESQRNTNIIGSRKNRYRMFSPLSKTIVTAAT
jgi:hypothetical protein